MNLSKDAPTIWEAGHYYTDKGPTSWSAKGWELMQQLKQTADSSMLFIDDIHSTEVLHPTEQKAEVVVFAPEADHVVLESAMKTTAMDVLAELKGLSKRKKAQQSKSGAWMLAEFPITASDGITPLCVLLDAALSVYKHSLGFEQGVNVLPGHYHGQQANLHRILKRVLPEFHMETLFFNLEGSIWTTKQEPVFSVPFKISKL